MKQQSAMHQLVERNIEALLERERQEKRRLGIQENIAAAITRFTGSLWFIYLHAILVLSWIAVNIGWTPLPKFDPTFVLLATLASVEAIFLTAFVLMTQNRMQADADRRADLDLQISLLTEHELTRLIQLVTRIAERMDIPGTHDPELKEMQRDVVPEQVLDTLEQKKHASEM